MGKIPSLLGLIKVRNIAGYLTQIQQCNTYKLVRVYFHLSCDIAFILPTARYARLFIIVYWYFFTILIN